MSRRFPLFTSSYSWMRRKGSRFTLGVWGLRMCSLDVAFTSATVRNRSREGRMAVPIVSSATGVTFGGFQASRWFVSRGRRGTSWHSDVFRSVSKAVLCGMRNTFAILLRHFLKMRCMFSWQAQHFGRVMTSASSFCMAGAASLEDVVLRRLLRIALSGLRPAVTRAASSGDNVQIPWQAWHFVRCDENWRKPRTKHWFWGSNFWGSSENS